MKFKDIKIVEHGGRIVKGVNTTADVGTDEIKKQAAKFGNSVDKDGRPPTLSKKVKGKSTNVLFNLGLAEGNRQSNLTDFVNFCKEQLNLKSSPPIKFVSDTEDTTFGYFDNDTKGIVIQNAGRHQMDVMRTVAHELVHYKQDQVYDRELNGEDGSPDENQANALAGVVLRRWGQKNPTLFTETVDKDTKSSVYFTNMQEQLGEIASESEIYVDMDGVLADFFGEWTRLMNVDHWSKIDNDGLPGALQKIRDTDEFWLRLPILPQAKELLTLIKNIKGEYNICSSPLQDDPNSEPHKREWIKKNLSFFPPKNVYITHNKPQYAKNKDGTANILIDDFGRNVKQWEDAGGIGFKYKDHKFERTARQLQKHMTEPVKESVTYVKPQFDAEWEEANRYPFLDKLGKDGWIELAQTGKVTNVNSNTVKKIGNTGADGSESLDDLEPEKVARLKQAMDAGTIEMPIVIKQPNGSYDLVAGNTRLIGLMNTHGEAKVWLVDASKLKQPIKEAFDTQIDWEEDSDMSSSDGEAYKANIGYKEVGIQYYFEVVDAGGFPLSGVDVTFEVNGTTKKTGGGDASTIFGAVVNHIKQFIKQHNEIDAIEFSASKEQGFSRTRLYSAMVDKLSQGTGFVNAKTISKADKSIENADVFKLIKKDAIDRLNLDIGEPKTESYTRNQMPQLTKKHLKTFPHKLEAMRLDKIIPVQKERLKENFKKQVKKIQKGIYNPIIVDSENKIINGHHRYDVIKKIGMQEITVAKLPITLEQILEKLVNPDPKLPNLKEPKKPSKYSSRKTALSKEEPVVKENFADGKKKGKSRPGRVKKSGASCNGSVTSLRKKAKNASGEKAKMYHWCANMKSGKKK